LEGEEGKLIAVFRTPKLQVHCVTSALMEYLKVDLIPKHPAACHELGIYVYPHLHLEGTN